MKSIVLLVSNRSPKLMVIIFFSRAYHDFREINTIWEPNQDNFFDLIPIYTYYTCFRVFFLQRQARGNNLHLDNRHNSQQHKFHSLFLALEADYLLWTTCSTRSPPAPPTIIQPPSVIQATTRRLIDRISENQRLLQKQEKHPEEWQGKEEPD